MVDRRVKPGDDGLVCCGVSASGPAMTTEWDAGAATAGVIGGLNDSLARFSEIP